MEIALSIVPVILFLLFLFLLDSFKLVVRKQLILAMLWGAASASLAYFANTSIIENGHINFETLSQYLAPASEEILKSLFIFLMIWKKRVGFIIDAAIYGFAIGAGFSLVENIFYWHISTEANMLIWIIRGLGTALMHGGCTSLFAMIVVAAKNRDQSEWASIVVAFLTAYIIHSGFNHFYINPILQTLGITIIFPLVFILIFKQHESKLQTWLEIEFNSEIELLNMINKGELRSTKAGVYLGSLKGRFAGETIIDMYCYLSLYLELSIKAKRNVMLKESGFPAIIEDDIETKLRELEQVRKQIGKVGELALSPLIRMNYRDLWKLNSLK